MYTKNNIIYADAGKVLKAPRIIGFAIPSFIESIEEHDVTLDDLTIENGVVVFNADIPCRLVYTPNKSYAFWKKKIIAIRFDNDDELAIILNKDESPEDETMFDKLQEWRSFASQLAHKILEVEQNNNE